MKPLRVAIVGTGLITERRHLPAVVGCADAALTALVDSDRERAHNLASRVGSDAKVASTLDEILPDVDAAVIATPNATHAPLAVQCLRAGVHVLIEKPLATSVQEGESIVAAAEASGAIAAVGYDRRFLGSVPLMKELLDENYFGVPRRFAYRFGTVGGWAPLSGYNIDRRTAGGGVLVVAGSHILDRFAYWFGDPTSCELWDDSEGGPEATAVCRFRYDDRGQTLEGEARFSKTVHMSEGFVLETDRGFVQFREQEDGILFRSAERPDLETWIRMRDRPGAQRLDTHTLQMIDFVEACRAGRPPRVPVHEGLASQRMIDRLYENRKPLGSDIKVPTEEVA